MPSHASRFGPLALIVLALLSAPQAVAEEDDPYYVRADAHPAAVDKAPDRERDCAAKSDSRGLDGSAAHASSQIRPNETRPNGSVAHLVPDCAAVDFNALGGACSPDACHSPRSSVASARATYQLSSGNFTLSAAPLGASSGNSGASLRFDCSTCPPPGVDMLP